MVPGAGFCSGPNWSTLGPSWGVALGTLLGGFWGTQGPLGEVLGASWGHLAAWDQVGGHFGPTYLHKPARAAPRAEDRRKTAPQSPDRPRQAPHEAFQRQYRNWPRQDARSVNNYFNAEKKRSRELKIIRILVVSRLHTLPTHDASIFTLTISRHR